MKETKDEEKNREKQYKTILWKEKMWKRKIVKNKIKLYCEDKKDGENEKET